MNSKDPPLQQMKKSSRWQLPKTMQVTLAAYSSDRRVTTCGLNCLDRKFSKISVLHCQQKRHEEFVRKPILTEFLVSSLRLSDRVKFTSHQTECSYTLGISSVDPVIKKKPSN